eukprot:jgi/Undpi1/10981/HiC_scaffold_30.g13282.m1
MLTPLASTRRLFGDKMTSEPADGSTSPSRKPPKLWPDAAAGKVGSVKKFIKNGGNLNARNKDTMWTLLHTASHAGQHLVVEALLSAGAKFDTEVEGKYNPLLLCCSCGSEGMVCPVTLALEKEDVEDPARRIECGHVKAAAALLKAGADTEATTDQLFTPLLIASFNGKLGLAKRLVAAGAKIEAKNKQQFTAACIAAQQGHVDLLGFLLDSGANIEASTDTKLTPLLIAAQEEQVSAVRLLLGAGARVKARNDRGIGPLSLASDFGRTDVVRLLLDAGAEIEGRDCRGNTPLMHACRQANINASNHRGFTALLRAAEGGHTATYKALVDRGADPLAVTSTGNTALHLASERGHLEMAKHLMDAGADMEASNSQGFTPLLVGTQHAHGAVAKELLNKGANPDATTARGFTPLMLACQYDQQELVTNLLDRGANIAAVQETGDTPLSLAAYFGRTGVVAELVRRGADVGCRDRDGLAPGEAFEERVNPTVRRRIQVALWGEKSDKNVADDKKKENAMSPTGAMPAAAEAAIRHKRSSVPLVISPPTAKQGGTKPWSALHKAVHRASVSTVRELLLDEDVDKEQEIERKFTPLLLAAQDGLVECISELIEAGANVEARTDTSFTPLLLAAKSGHLEAVRELRVAGRADVESSNSRSFTPLLLACQNNHYEVVHELVVEAKANIEARTDQGYTPLLVACQAGNLELAKFLVSHGAELGAVTARGMSALHLAAETGAAGLLRMLCDAGAPLEIASCTWDTPLTLATYFGHIEAVEELLSLGANANAVDEDGQAAESGTHIVGECEVYKEQRDMLEEEIWKVDECDMEEFGRLKSGRSFDESVGEGTRLKLKKILRDARSLSNVDEGMMRDIEHEEQGEPPLIAIAADRKGC